MKKILLTLTLALAGFSVNSQVIFSVEAPSSISGGYEMTYARSTDWTVPDMANPANFVLDTIVMANDLSTTSDSLMCVAAAANSLNGKIAMLYRGTCNFSTKAKMAQNAGAVAVIIINNIGGLPVGMAGGTDGMTVTIPVIMISDVDGALIRARIDAGDKVVGFIGNKSGYYQVDLGTTLKHIMIAPSQSVPLTIARNTTEFPISLGAYAFNYGSQLQTGATMRAEITRVGTSTPVYTETSNAFDFVAGTSESDSIWIEFTPPSISNFQIGEYKITYTLISTTGDDYPSDNVVSSSFHITEDVFTLARLKANGRPQSDGGSQPQNPDGSFTNCIVFRSPNGSKVGAEGLYFAISKNAASGTIEGEEVILQGFKWLDQFDDTEDSGFAFDNLEELGAANYTYDGDYQDSMVYQPFATPFIMEDDQRYLFCITTFNEEVFLAYDTRTKYDMLDVFDPQPRGPIKIGDAWGIGFVGNPVPAIGLKTYSNTAGIAENNIAETSVYPNPAKENVTISIKGFTGDAHMTVTDVAGKIVISKTITADANGNVKVNTAELNNGMYIFNLEMTDGKVSKSNVVINK